MNAIISLCHFCEVHGPSILFCTQAFHTPEPQNVLPGQLSPSPAGVAGGGWNASERACSAAWEAGSTHLPSGHLAGGSGSKTDSCEACHSFTSGQVGFVSYDHEAKVRYVSSQHPNHPQVFSMVRTGCVRSLSCEVCPGREGPIFFGDEHHGHVFSHTFFLGDSHARGLERYYSIIVVMMDHVFLLNSWPFLVSNIKDLINELQTKATAVFTDEQAKCPQRAHRLQTRFHRGGSKSVRSLIELTNDKLIFHRLHQSFTWILKAGGSRLTERLLEGPPTEDSIIDFEKQEETEEGFVMLHSIKDTPDEDEEEEETGVEEVDDPTIPMFTDLRHMLKEGRVQCRADIQLDDCQFQSANSTLSHQCPGWLQLNVLGYQRFHNLIHHVIIGNQVIIRSSQKKVSRSMIDCLKMLLPRGCCRVIYYSDKYEDSWRCNFLGLSPTTPLPEHTDLYYVSVEIIQPELVLESVEKPSSDSTLTGYTFEVTASKMLPDKVPGVQNKIEQALLNERLANSVFDQCLISIKEEWMNKVKVLFKFTKAGGNRSEEDTKKLLAVVGVNSEDKMVLQFWMTGLSVQYRNHMLSSAIGHSV